MAIFRVSGNLAQSVENLLQVLALDDQITPFTKVCADLTGKVYIKDPLLLLGSKT